MMPIIDEFQRIALTSEDVNVIQNCLYHLSIIVNNMPEKQKALYSVEQKCLHTKIVNEFFVPTVNKIVTSKVSILILSDILLDSFILIEYYCFECLLLILLSL